MFDANHDDTGDDDDDEDFTIIHFMIPILEPDYDLPCRVFGYHRTNLMAVRTLLAI